MDTPADLWLFATLVFGVVVLPGMDMAFVAGSAVAAGRRAGLAAVAGIMLGGQVHLLAALLGLASLLAWWPGARAALALAGAAYMAWVGWTLWRPPTATAPSGAGPQQPGQNARQAFVRAALTCLMNPKAYAFTLAVLPPFMQAPGRAPFVQALWLGGIIAANQALVYGAVAMLAAAARPWLPGGGRAQRWAPKAVGGLLIVAALGMAAAVAGADRKSVV
jgi:threonine/homoserine/homoserine lactone efflux protein